MKQRISKFWDKTVRRFKKLLKGKKDVVYPIKVPISGVDEKDIKKHDGFLEIETDHHVRIVESKFKDGSAYISSYGYSRNIVLPEDISVDEVQYVLDPHTVYIGWYKY